MTDINSIINTLTEAGIHVFVSEGQLKTKSLKGALKPALIQLIKSHKEQLIEHLTGHSNQINHVERPSLSQITIDSKKNAKLSFAQQRLWFIDQMDGGSVHYNMPFVLEVTGEFNSQIAESTILKIIERHEPLRTVYLNHNKAPNQSVLKSFEWHLGSLDLTQLSNNEQQQQIQSAIKQHAQRHFDLQSDIMLKADYLKISNSEGLLLLNIHHIAFDGWSIDIFFKEFVHIYNALLKGVKPDLTPLPIRYVDYTYWQQQLLNGDLGAQQLDYWKKQLADLPQLHSLPLDKERPKFQTYNGALHTFTIGSHTFAQLKQLAADQQVTLFMLVHSVFSILLSRFSNQSDIVIGTPIANRMQKELEPLIGFFANTLILRTECHGEGSFIDYLQQVKKVNLNAQANQDIPFEWLVDELQPIRSTSHNPLFQVLLMADGDQLPEVKIAGAQLTKYPSDDVPNKFELTLNFSIDQDKLNCIFQYNTDLFATNTIQRFAHALQHLFKRVSTHPTGKLAELSLLSDEEIAQLLVSKTCIDYPTDLSVHQNF